MLAIKNWWSKQLLQTRITIILVAGLSVGLLFCSLIGYSIISNIISSNIQFQISNINPRILGFHGFESENLSPDMPFIAHISRELMTALVKYLFFTTIFIVVLGGVVAYFVSKKQLMEITKTNQAQENFVSDVSHELRTPLTVIRGQIDLYKTKRNRAEGLRAKGHTAKGNSKRMPTNSKEFSLIEADKHLENIEYSTIQMQNLLDELLALSRLDANKGLFDAKVNLIEAIHLAIRSIPY
ncbi:MAG: hypothetical protein LBT85_03805, partial [Bifidobacteriaceae bacterium]|nr:hypothetical protein [Bifidobacteriaceae bacterium]